MIRSATATASAEAVSGRTTRNSSPPKRAQRSYGRSTARNASATAVSAASPDEVAVAVVDLAHVVDVADEHRERPAGAPRARELAARRLVDAARVEQARLVVAERLRAQRRHGDGPLDEEERQDRHDDERRLVEKREGDADSDRRDAAVGDEAVEGEEPARRGIVAAREPEHAGEQAVVDRDVRDAAPAAAAATETSRARSA